MKNMISKFQFKLIVLIGIFALLLYVTSKTGNMEEFAQKILNGGTTEVDPTAVTTESFTEAQQEAMKKQFQGYWKFAGEESPGVYLEDYIELLENGIMWQYERRIFSLPYSGKDTLVRVSTSYLLPFEKRGEDSASAICYLRVIRQNWQMDGEYCYGPSQKILDDIYSAKAQTSDIVVNKDVTRFNDTSLIYASNSYTKFIGEPVAFFPDPKAIVSVDDPTTYGCEGDDPHLVWIRNRIAESIKSQELELNVIPIEQKLNIVNYYIPYCLNRLTMYYGKNEGELITMILQVSPTGVITDVKLKGKPVESPAIQKNLAEEIKKWVIHGTGSKTELTITMKAKSHE